MILSYMNCPFSQGLSLEVLPPSWLSAHESDRDCPAWKAQADPGLWAPHEHHCWCHHRSAVYQKQGDSLCLCLSLCLSLLFSVSLCITLCDFPSSFLSSWLTILKLFLSVQLYAFPLFGIEVVEVSIKSERISILLFLLNKSCMMISPLSLFLGNQCHSCECRCRFLPGSQHPYDCRGEWYVCFKD